MIASTPLAIVFLLAALFSAVEFGRKRGGAEVESYIADREAQATHVLMNGGMAAMFAPFYDGTIGRAIAIVYAVAIIVIAVRLIVLLARGDAAVPNRVAGSLYHALGLAAMIYAIGLMRMDMAQMGGMAPVTGVLPFVLGATFALDGVATAVLVLLFPSMLISMQRRIDGPASVLRVRDAETMRAIRIAAIPHCIMDAGMALMLLA